MNVNVWLDTFKFTLREYKDSVLLDSRQAGTIRLFVNDSGNLAIEFLDIEDDEQVFELAGSWLEVD